MSTVEIETPPQPVVEDAVSTLSQMQRILESVKHWPVPQRVSLARRILETVENSALQPTTGPLPVVRGRPVEELIGLAAGDKPPPPPGMSSAELMAFLKTDRPAPDDATIKLWIDEHRMEKYGP